MTGRLIVTSFLEALFVVMVGWYIISNASAQVSTSTNYQIQSDSINFGGGLSTSDSYGLESTAGEIATGLSTSSSYRLRAGYQQMQDAFISISAAPAVIMSPSLEGLSGGIANGSTSVLVITDSPSGYGLTIVVPTAPAMQSATDAIDDYVPVATPNPDYSFNTGTGQAHLGFSPFGDDVVLRYRNNTIACSIGGLSTEQVCWDGLSTSAQLIASGASNQPEGASTTIFFRVGIDGAVGLTPGTYVATTTLTALPL